MTEANARAVLLVDDMVGIGHWSDIADDVLAAAGTEVVNETVTI